MLREKSPRKRKVRRPVTRSQSSAIAAEVLDGWETDGTDARDFPSNENLQAHHELSDSPSEMSRRRAALERTVQDTRFGEEKRFPKGKGKAAHKRYEGHTSSSEEKVNRNHEKRQAELVCGLIDHLKRTTLPPAALDIFTGDPLTYPSWKASFDALVEDKGLTAAEKMAYLKANTGGAARQCLEGMFLLSSERGYRAARVQLEERFGSEWAVVEAFRRRLASHPKVSKRDEKGLQSFADLLQACRIAAEEHSGLASLDDPLIQRDLLRKLPDWVISKWSSRVQECGSYPSFAAFSQFITQMARQANDPIMSLNAVLSQGEATVRSTSTAERNSCPACTEPNDIPQCDFFESLPLRDRRALVRDKGLCYGCLKTGHQIKDCQSRATCSTCRGRHPTLLHEERTATNRHTQAGDACMSSQIIPAFLSRVESPHQEKLVYCLIDNQSDTTFLTTETAKQLGIRGDDCSLNIKTLTSHTSERCQRLRGLRLRGLYQEEVVELGSVYTTKFIPANKEHIPTKKKAAKWPHLRDLPLPPLMDAEVCILIGYDCPDILRPLDTRFGEPGEPFGIKSALGWAVVGGKAPGPSMTMCHRIQAIDPSKEELLAVLNQGFEDAHDPSKLSQEDMKSMDIMSQGLGRTAEGNLELPLPLVSDVRNLPTSKSQALSRLQSLKRRFDRDHDFHAQYKHQMQIMFERGEAEEASSDGGEEWFIPHHGVVNKEKAKLRVVFDCAASNHGVSLNSLLLQGPDLINNMLGVLLRFRTEKIALTCDIERMFYAFSVTPPHRNLLKFLWWPDEDYRQPPREYCMTRHIFGAKSSPAVANFALKAACSLLPLSKEASSFVKEDFYVDDGLASVGSVDEAKTLAQETTSSLSKVGIKLHKFLSNSREVMEALSPKVQPPSHKDLIEKVLGVSWCLEHDQLVFRITLTDKPATRRGILSCLASVFDPLGLLAPFILVGKLILRDVLQTKQGWDDPVPEDMGVRWEQWRSQIPELAKIRLDRCFKGGLEGKVKLELHAFSDASELAYGQCTYVRAEDEQGRTRVTLAMAKARVAPPKTQTIPRLELQAATLSAQVASFIAHEMRGIEKVYLWTDSQVVLAYLHNEEKRFQVFVANRVAKIKGLTEVDQWRHVVSECNPADHTSRGLTVDNLTASDWFGGPSFLADNTYQQESPDRFTLEQSDPEIRRTCCRTLAQTNFSVIVDAVCRRSNFNSCLRVISFVRRFAMKSSQGPLSKEEISEARTLIIHSFQHYSFGEDIKSIQRTGRVPRNSSLASSDVFLDAEGLLRVGGRLKHADLPIDEKNPVVIPKGHLAKLLVRQAHHEVYHAGRGMTLNHLRSQFWVLGGSKAVQSEIHGCVTCRRTRGKPVPPKMADLPSERVNPAPPFTHTGMDCFGPFTTKDGRRETKRYGLVLTCMTSRAVHLEVLGDLTADCLLLGLRRFISLRGSVKTIFCDNGTNFVGANHELKKALSQIKEEDLREKMMKHQVAFRWNAPSASHMGGVYERQIRTVRSILSLMLKANGSRVTMEELRTLFYECANIVNSRPLSVQSLADPCSLPPLTPNHLLQFREPDPGPPGVFENDVYGRRRWRRVQDLASQLWVRWRKEFLLGQNERKKWTFSVEQIKVGDVVAVFEENPLVRTSRLGRVHKVLPSECDSRIRKVEIAVASQELDHQGRRRSSLNTIVRPVNKLVILHRAPVD